LGLAFWQKPTESPVIGKASEISGRRGEAASPGRRDQTIERVPFKIVKPILAREAESPGFVFETDSRVPGNARKK